MDLTHGEHIGKLKHPAHDIGIARLGGLRILMTPDEMRVSFRGLPSLKDSARVMDRFSIRKGSPRESAVLPASDIATSMLRLNSPDGKHVSLAIVNKCSLTD